MVGVMSPRRSLPSPPLPAVLTLALLAAAPGCRRHERRAPPRATATTAAIATTAPATRASVITPAVLPAHEAALLASWYQRVGARQPGESFGALVARAARVQVGKPYLDEPAPAGPEELTVRLEDFQCVSLVESSLALARCVAADRPEPACFVRELEAWRYRDGKLDGFASKLHYFSEWLSDAERRGRLVDLGPALGGKPHPATFDFMSRHPARYAPLADPAVLTGIRDVEARLRTEPAPLVVGRDALAGVQGQLESGDVLAIVGRKDDILVTHAALVWRDTRGVPRALHASSAHHRVIVGDGDVAEFIRHRPEWRGVIAARPVEPAQTPPTRSR
jgi:hypothetical protein